MLGGHLRPGAAHVRLRGCGHGRPCMNPGAMGSVTGVGRPELAGRGGDRMDVSTSGARVIACRRPSGPDPRRGLAKRMADGQPLDQPLDWPVGAVLDLAFDSGMLHTLRARVRKHACQAGLSEGRAEDVVLAVHELAANAVRHGIGTGRLRLWKRAGALYCQVEDGNPPAADDPAEQRAVYGEGHMASAAESSVRRLPSRPGHGLWVVRRVADRMRILSGARGTCATATFNLSAQGGPLLAPSADGPASRT